jgi:hypothetical protein
MKTKNKPAIGAVPKTKQNYTNTTTYNRAIKNKENTYKKFSSSLLNDDRLTDLELGIMIRILKNSDTYIFNKDYCQKNSGFGIDIYEKAIKHLKELGYISIERKQSGFRWIINEIASVSND